LGGVAQPEGHEGKLEQAEWSGNCSLLNIIGMDGDLVIRSHQVDFGEDGATGKLVRVIMDVRLTGACSACPSAQFTLEDVVRSEVMTALPNVKYVALDRGVSDDLLDFAKQILNKEKAV
jgi:hypothetical protein